MDGSDAQSDLTQAEYHTGILLEGFSVSFENAFVTKAPTRSPSNTHIPSAAPSITGISPVCVLYAFLF